MKNVIRKILINRNQLNRTNQQNKLSAGATSIDSKILCDWGCSNLEYICISPFSDGFQESEPKLEESMLRILDILDVLDDIDNRDNLLYTLELLPDNIFMGLR